MTSLVFIVANDIAEVAGSVSNKKEISGRRPSGSQILSRFRNLFD
jgi:hypothetical protein